MSDGVHRNSTCFRALLKEADQGKALPYASRYREIQGTPMLLGGPAGRRDFRKLVVEHQDGSQYRVRAGMTYHVADDAGAHRAYSDEGARFFIVD